MGGRHSATSDGGKVKKGELLNLSKKATTMKHIKIASSAQDCKKLLKDKLQINEGKFPVSKIFIVRTHHLPFLSLTTKALNSLYSSLHS